MIKIVIYVFDIKFVWSFKENVKVGLFYSIIIIRCGFLSLKLGNKMAYDEALAKRVKKMLQDEDGFREQKMFGGIAYMLHGNMCCGIHEDNLILRLNKALAREALETKEAYLFDMTGKPMNTIVTIPRDNVKTPVKLKKWMKMALAFNQTLPPKMKK